MVNGDDEHNLIYIPVLAGVVAGCILLILGGVVLLLYQTEANLLLKNKPIGFLQRRRLLLMQNE